MKIAFKKAIRHYKYVTQRFICQLISFQLVTSNIKIVWNCLVAWSMWKKGVKILSGNDDCLDLSASYFVFPHIWENQSFFTTSYREEVKQRGPLCYSTTSVQWQSSTRKKKNLNQTQSKASAWHKRRRIFFQNFGQLEGLSWAAKKELPRFRVLVQCLSVCQIDFTVDEKQTKGVIDSTLSQVFEGQVTKPSVKIQHILASASCSKWPFYFISTKELYETYHHIRLGRGFQDDSWSSRPFQHGTST